MNRSGFLTIAGIVAALSIVTVVAGCTDDDTDQDRPTRIVCVESGKVVMDDFAKKGEAVFLSDSSLSFKSDTQQGSVSAIGNCFSRPQEKPKDWKPVFPG